MSTPIFDLLLANWKATHDGDHPGGSVGLPPKAKPEPKVPPANSKNTIRAKLRRPK
ncbi:MAG: hypothetical protein ACOH10_15345 [Rhodoglobus sp.]